jgi:hypothetical protein
MQHTTPAASSIASSLRSDPVVTLATLFAGAAMLIVSAAMMLTDGQIFTIAASSLPG